jgi:hypothetical protein
MKTTGTAIGLALVVALSCPGRGSRGAVGEILLLPIISVRILDQGCRISYGDFY